jgi:LmbE family N-acetylglucosaminyl deacetylase
MDKKIFSFAGLMFLATLVVGMAGIVLAAETPGDGKLRIIGVGAHPDDCELKAGGVAAMWAAQGHHVKFVALVNGDLGHWKMGGGPLAQRRTKEVQEAAKILGVEETVVLDNHDGELTASLENRMVVAKLIREWQADIVLMHRPNDYHPDHRYAGILVQDAAFMATVPHAFPSTPHLANEPVCLFMTDDFDKPNPLRPNIVISIDKVVEQKRKAISVIDSQFAEGGCCGAAHEKVIPKNKAELERRRREATAFWLSEWEKDATRYRAKLIEIYGEEKGKKVQYAEPFEVSPYGRQPSIAELKQLFLFQEQ